MSLQISSSLNISGSVVAHSVTSSLLGTASFATTASFVSSANTSVSASYATSASLADFAKAYAGQGITIEFTASSATWLVSHNLLTKYPLVSIWQSGSNEIIQPDNIRSLNEQQVEITFKVPQAGFVNVAMAGTPIPPPTASFGPTASYAFTSSYALNIGDTSNLITTGSQNTSQTLNGLLIVSGALEVTEGITGSLLGTASLALTASSVIGEVPSASLAATASLASTASFAQASETASFVATASLAATASFVVASLTASFVQTAQTASRVLGSNVIGTVANAETASIAVSASWAPLPAASPSASFASSSLTASYVEIAQTASFVATAQTASRVLAANVIGTVANTTSASIATTASFVQTAQTASRVLGSNVIGDVLTSSFAITASFALNGGGGGGGSSTPGPGTFTGSFGINDFPSDNFGFSVSMSSMVVDLNDSQSYQYVFFGQREEGVPYTRNGARLDYQLAPNGFSGKVQLVHIDNSGGVGNSGEWAGLTVGTSKGNGNNFNGLSLFSNGRRNSISGFMAESIGHLNLTVLGAGSSAIKVVPTLLTDPTGFPKQSVQFGVSDDAYRDAPNIRTHARVSIFGNTDLNPTRNIPLRPQLEFVNDTTPYTLNDGQNTMIVGGGDVNFGDGTRLEFWQNRTNIPSGVTNRPFFKIYANWGGDLLVSRFTMGRTDLLTATLDAGRMVAGTTVTVSGSIYADAFQVPSDRRLKENIEVLTGSLEVVNALNPVRFTMIGDDNKKQKIGFIAQDIESIVPEAVQGSEDTTYSMTYETVVPLNTKAIQELSTMVTDLMAQVSELKAEIAELKNK